jgi:glycine/D-amino acid oxidase-like deaminating enzyme
LAVCHIAIASCPSSNAWIAHTHFALAYGGNGITYSVIAAKIIRDEILGRPSPDAVIFSFNR